MNARWGRLESAVVAFFWVDGDQSSLSQLESAETSLSWTSHPQDRHLASPCSLGEPQGVCHALLPNRYSAALNGRHKLNFGICRGSSDTYQQYCPLCVSAQILSD